MFDTRAWRGPAVVGGDGIKPPTSTGLAEHAPTFADFWFWQMADIDQVLCHVRYSG